LENGDLKKCNVLIIVLDTLRDDYSAGLDNLVKQGFLRFREGVSPSSWTLPSHVSMLTGQLPSMHGVHEKFGMYLRELTKVSTAKLGTSNENLITELRSLGYKTYCASANPIISPEYGFLFDEYREFNSTGEITMDGNLLRNNPGRMRSGMILLKNLRIRRVARGLRFYFLSKILASFGLQQLERGSKYITKYFERAHFDDPFFAFVNLMEAHNPYTWGERGESIRPSILGKPVNLPHWRDSYPLHVKLAVKRALKIVSLLMKYDPLIIVTSDHGQLLGEGGRYDHGYFLDDELIKVPLYVRFPGGKIEFESGGQFVSLTEIPRIVNSVISGKQCRLGTDYAISESFGSYVDLKDTSPDTLHRVFARRTRVLSTGGSITYNQDTGIVEDATQGLTSEQINQLKELISSQDGNDRIESDEKMPVENEIQVRKRLRELGYE
jgi:Sulfatase